jgi:UDP-N-acetylglucosamine transferase subunit ALG13
MSDRVIIDHMNNNIIVHIGTCDLSQMENSEIIEFLQKLSHQLGTAHIKHIPVSEIIAETSPS